MLNIKKILKGLRILNDIDQSKTVEMSVSNTATTNTKTTLNVTQTANRTLSTPSDGASATLLTDTSIQSVSNKTVSLANTTDNKILVSQATTHTIVDSGITHTNSSGDVTLSVMGSATIAAPTNKNVIINGKSLVIPIVTFNPVTPPTDVTAALVFNAFNNLPYINNGTTFVPLTAPVTSVNGLTGNVVLNTDNISEGATNLYFTNSRAQAALVSNLALKANQSLNNLTSTSINQSLLPASDITSNIGSAALRWANAFFNYTKSSVYSVLDSSGIEVGKFEYFTFFSPSGNTASVRMSTTTSGNLLASTVNSNTVDASPTSDILVETGNKSAGTGNSGNISLRTGTSSGGVRGVANIDAAYETHSVNGVVVTEDHYFSNITLTSNVTNNTIAAISFPINTYRTAIFEYRLTDIDNANFRVGRLMIATDGVNINVGMSDTSVEVAPIPVTFSAIISGSNINIRQTNTLTGFIYLSGKFTMIKG